MARLPSQYFTSLKAEHLEGRWWRLTAPLVFYSHTLDMTITTPAGFVTDFSSVPRIPVAYWLTGATCHWEGAGHDMDYRWGLISRKQADWRYGEAQAVRAGMRTNQSWWYRLGRALRRGTMTATLRALGWTSYRHRPGCLDQRGCQAPNTKMCPDCPRYVPNPELYYLKGFVPPVTKRKRLIP